MKRAVIYARYSSDNQRAESIDAQVRICTAYCKRKQYIVTKIYKDEALSGRSTEKRKNYKALLADARQGLFDIIIFHKIDRNARNEYDYYLFKSQMQQLGIEYQYAEQNIDSSAEGQLMENNLVGFAAYYSRNLANEVRKGKRESALKALFPGGTPPLGYDVIDKQYVINEYEAEAIRLIFKMYLVDYGYRAIAEELNKRGYKTKAGKSFGKNSLYEIITNPRYAGTYVQGKVLILPDGRRNNHGQGKDMLVLEDAIPAIISKLDFERAKAKVIRNKHTAARYRANVDYLLSGKVFCSCGMAYIGNTITTRGHKYTYYRCNCQVAKAKGTIDCSNKMIRKDYLESTVIDVLLKKVFACDIDKVLENARKNIESQKPTNANLKELIDKRKGLEMRLNNLYNIIEKDIADDYDLERLAGIKKELTHVKKSIEQINNSPNLSISYNYFKKMWGEYKEFLTQNKNNGSDEIRTVINNCIDRILVTPKTLEITCVLEVCGYSGAVGEI